MGERITRRVPLRTVHGIWSAIFLVLGVLAAHRCFLIVLAMRAFAIVAHAPICHSLRALYKSC